MTPNAQRPTPNASLTWLFTPSSSNVRGIGFCDVRKLIVAFGKPDTGPETWSYYRYPDATRESHDLLACAESIGSIVAQFKNEPGGRNFTRMTVVEVAIFIADLSSAGFQPVSPEGPRTSVCAPESITPSLPHSNPHSPEVF